jgi:hypothetical protein
MNDEITWGMIKGFGRAEKGKDNWAGKPNVTNGCKSTGLNSW